MRKSDKEFEEKYLSKVKHCCDTCEFGFVDVCADTIINPETGEEVYGMPIEDAKRFYPDGCEGWGISYSEYEKCCIEYEKDGGYLLPW